MIIVTDPHVLAQQVSHLADHRDNVAAMLSDDAPRCPIVRRETRTRVLRLGSARVVRQYEAVVAYSAVPKFNERNK
jgi:hypothetical protein